MDWGILLRWVRRHGNPNGSLWIASFHLSLKSSDWLLLHGITSLSCAQRRPALSKLIGQQCLSNVSERRAQRISSYQALDLSHDWRSLACWLMPRLFLRWQLIKVPTFVLMVFTPDSSSVWLYRWCRLRPALWQTSSSRWDGACGAPDGRLW